MLYLYFTTNNTNSNTIPQARTVSNKTVGRLLLLLSATEREVVGSFVMNGRPTDQPTNQLTLVVVPSPNGGPWGGRSRFGCWMFVG